ncbi:hypothetical protein DPMN_192951 [Dreissena polymorpha]|uniref:Uncharacterized protein n=1 Tax=Dreissena polymorpha TaxID=45954 RepID=A0A9D4BD26_DREPO|nr:hypothetical protein DPMN_192951 [Dreissena polymorpha]
MITVVGSPRVVLTHVDIGLIAIAPDIVQPDRGGAGAVVCTWFWLGSGTYGQMYR